MQSARNHIQRQCERKSVRLKGLLINQNIQTKVTLVDISEKGIGFLSHEKYEIGQELELELPVNGRNQVFLKLRIKNLMSDNFANRIGAELIEVSQKFVQYVKGLFTKSRSMLMRSLQERETSVEGVNAERLDWAFRQHIPGT